MLKKKSLHLQGFFQLMNIFPYELFTDFAGAALVF